MENDDAEEQGKGYATLITLIEIMGLSTLVFTTAIIISLSIISRGALIYYYEQNSIIWGSEVILGICGVMVGIKKIKECF